MTQCSVAAAAGLTPDLTLHRQSAAPEVRP